VDLWDLILDDDDLRSSAKALVRGEPREGALGAEEVIRVVLVDSALVTAVAACVRAWLANRRSRLKLTVRSGARSVEVEVDGTDSEVLAQVSAALSIAVRGDRDEAAQQ
jgi:hypothetical protein